MRYEIIEVVQPGTIFRHYEIKRVYELGPVLTWRTTVKRCMGGFAGEEYWEPITFPAQAQAEEYVNALVNGKKRPHRRVVRVIRAE